MADIIYLVFAIPTLAAALLLQFGLLWFTATYLLLIIVFPLSQKITDGDRRFLIRALGYGFGIPFLILDVGFNFTYGYLLGARPDGAVTLSERLHYIRDYAGEYRLWQRHVAAAMRTLIELVDPLHFAGPSRPLH